MPATPTRRQSTRLSTIAKQVQQPVSSSSVSPGRITRSRGTPHTPRYQSPEPLSDSSASGSGPSSFAEVEHHIQKKISSRRASTTNTPTRPTTPKEATSMTPKVNGRPLRKCRVEGPLNFDLDMTPTSALSLRPKRRSVQVQVQNTPTTNADKELSPTKTPSRSRTRTTPASTINLSPKRKSSKAVQGQGIPTGTGDTTDEDFSLLKISTPSKPTSTRSREKPKPKSPPSIPVAIADGQPNLPCREAQYDEIWSFLRAGVEERDSRCLYVSGVPGTGKTLVVKAVLNQMLEVSPDTFKYIFVNSLSLGTPERIWSRMHKALGLKSTAGTKPNQIQQKVERYLQTDHLPVILVVDELDQLLDKRQSILYTLLEWTSKPTFCIAFIAIFNTMNLPETALAARNASRMGFNRVVFAPYTHQELQRIVTHHLGEIKTQLLQDALILLARKVAGISGDARRAIEIANRTLEIIEANGLNGGATGGAKAVQDAFRELFSSPHIHALKSCSKLEREVVRRLVAILQSTGADNTLIIHVVTGVQSAALFDGYPKWTSDQILAAITRLFASKLVLMETGRASMHAMITLGVAAEDVNYALGLPKQNAHED